MQVLFYRILNSIFFYVGWGAWIYSSHGGSYINPLLITLMGVTIHLFSQKHPLIELLYMLIIVFLGIGLEALYRIGPLFIYIEDITWPPLWMIGIYIVYSTSIGSCLGYLANRWRTMSFLGAVGGGLSYASGVLLSSASYGVDRSAALLIISAVWAFFLPLCFWIRDFIYFKLLEIN